MFLFLLPPIAYGWGYRGWGPPFPRYIQRRRGQQATAGGEVVAFDHHAWGWGGDLIWVGLMMGVFGACSALWWR